MTVKYSPRLVKGIRRSFNLHIPDEMYLGLKKIARSEKRSIGWVIERVIEDWYNFGIDYKNIKKVRNGR